jgi:hypothetical protein
MSTEVQHQSMPQWRLGHRSAQEQGRELLEHVAAQLRNETVRMTMERRRRYANDIEQALTDGVTVLHSDTIVPQATDGGHA